MVRSGSGGLRCTYPGQVPEGSVQRLGEVPESSGADPEVRFRKVPVQRLGEVLQGSSADT